MASTYKCHRCDGAVYINVDNDLNSMFYTSGETDDFNVSKTGRIGIDATAVLTIKNVEEISNDLYYNLTPINDTLNTNVKKEIIRDTVNNINSNSLSKRIKQNLSTQTIIQNHSTVTDYFCNIVEKSENGFQNKDKEIIISFTLSIKKGDLINVNNYNNYQQKLYDLIKKYKVVDKISYNRIRDILFEKGYRSVRTNKVLKSNYIWSIYKKGMIREKRMKIFNSKYSHIKLNIKHL